MSSTRSRMLARPRPGRTRSASGSKPAPSSRIERRTPPDSASSARSIVFARAWRAALRRASWATRKRPSEASRESSGTDSGARSRTGSDSRVARRSHSMRRASVRPRSSSVEGWSWYARRCTSSEIFVSSPRISAAPPASSREVEWRSSCAASIERRARRWLRSSWSSRAIDLRSSSWAVMRRRFRARTRSSARRRRARWASSAADQERLDDDDREARQGLATVCLPEGRRPEPDLAAGRQPAGVDAPAMELAPVVEVAERLDGGNRHCGGRLAAQKRQRDLRAPLSFTLDRDERSADDALAELALEEPEHRGTRRGSDRGETLVLFVRHAGGVDVEGAVKDRRVGGQRGDAAPHGLEGEKVEPLELDPARERRELALDLDAPEPLERGVAEHHGHPIRARDEALDVLDDAGRVDADGDDRLVRRGRDFPHVANVETGRQQRDGLEQGSAVAGDEARGRRSDGDHEIEAAVLDQGADVVDEWPFLGRLGEAREFEGGLQELDRAGPPAGDLRADRRRESVPRCEAISERADDQHPARLRLRRAENVRTRQNEKGDGRRERAGQQPPAVARTGSCLRRAEASRTGRRAPGRGS